MDGWIDQLINYVMFEYCSTEVLKMTVEGAWCGVEADLCQKEIGCKDFECSLP